MPARAVVLTTAATWTAIAVVGCSLFACSGGKDTTLRVDVFARDSDRQPVATAFLPTIRRGDGIADTEACFSGVRRRIAVADRFSLPGLTLRFRGAQGVEARLYRMRRGRLRRLGRGSLGSQIIDSGSFDVLQFRELPRGPALLSADAARVVISRGDRCFGIDLVVR